MQTIRILFSRHAGPHRLQPGEQERILEPNPSSPLFEPLRYAVRHIGDFRMDDDDPELTSFYWAPEADHELDRRSGVRRVKEKEGSE
jgi:hypothetical protein